ncbi:hypothetical protein OHA77_03940 [Streptosporangium sp. NBC_01639]|nr:hypothetical protein OHA77_03940 [Streptosporangium sp. NBC_01639]
MIATERIAAVKRRKRLAIARALRDRQGALLLEEGTPAGDPPVEPS